MRIAICIRGSLRTWEFCKYSIFNTFNGIARENIFVDWFVDIWDIDQVQTHHVSKTGEIFSTDDFKHITKSDLDLIRQDFYERGLSLSLTLHEFDKSLPSHKSYLKLQYIGNMSKRKFELANNMRFDVVVQCRPDVIFHVDEAQKNELIESIWGCGVSNSLNFRKSEEHDDFTGFLKILKNSTHFAGFEHLPMPSDLIFFGNTAIMDFLANAYIRTSNTEYEIPSVAHYSHFLHLIRKSIFINDYFPHWSIVRRISIDGVFNYEEELEKIQKSKTYDDAVIKKIGATSKLWYDLIHATQNKQVTANEN